MAKYKPEDFWERFGLLAGKDLPVLVKTGISQSTLSGWRSKNIFPRADEAILIADALKTSVDFLVTGLEKPYQEHSQESAEVASLMDKMDVKGKATIVELVKAFAYRQNLKKDEKESAK